MSNILDFLAGGGRGKLEVFEGESNGAMIEIPIPEGVRSIFYIITGGGGGGGGWFSSLPGGGGGGAQIRSGFAAVTPGLHTSVRFWAGLKGVGEEIGAGAMGGAGGPSTLKFNDETFIVTAYGGGGGSRGGDVETGSQGGLGGGLQAASHSFFRDPTDIDVPLHAISTGDNSTGACGGKAGRAGGATGYAKGGYPGGGPTVCGGGGGASVGPGGVGNISGNGEKGGGGGGGTVSLKGGDGGASYYMIAFVNPTL